MTQLLPPVVPDFILPPFSLPSVSLSLGLSSISRLVLCVLKKKSLMLIDF